ncbi:MAG: hypothetical protein L6R35_002556 [Caloplaca aegaea]|nr:MAG: hypothetical protein L6R35_002556 [Caloplaca aegaea]
MGWSSILRKFTKREQASLGSRDQGGPRWDESNPTVAEPSVAIGSNHGGDYDPNQKEKPLIDSHGGDYDPNQYNFTSSDRSKDHGVLQYTTIRWNSVINQDRPPVVASTPNQVDPGVRGDEPIATRRLLQ